MPLRQASSHTTSAVNTPPAIAASAIAARFWPNITIATSTPLQAPVLKPITFRAAQRVTHQRLKNGAADAKPRTDQQGHQHPRQSPFGDHHSDVTRRIAQQSGKHLLDA
ncbi:Uncharacterised protein [Raoultella ornithinolytica]|nr:Uncharacterised protein [Raoultella ornithinolytica]